MRLTCSAPTTASKLDTRLLDACVGDNEIAQCAVFPTGATLTIWREGESLLAQPRSGSATPGALAIWPASETNFFFKIDGSQLTFIKNDKGEVTAVIHRASRGGTPDTLGRKLTGPIQQR